MRTKKENWFVLIVSCLALLGIIWTIYKDLNYFLTKKEAQATITSISQPSDFVITANYYNEYLKKQIDCSVKTKSSNKSKVENLGKSVKVYYSKAFPNSIYIESLSHPTIGMLIFLFLVMIFVSFAVFSSVNGIRN